MRRSPRPAAVCTSGVRLAPGPDAHLRAQGSSSAQPLVSHRPITRYSDVVDVLTELKILRY